MSDCKRICLWSGPRNVSTALMYAFDQRSDTTCVDEPLYGHYLQVSGAVHPGGDEVMAAMDCDGDRVVREVVLGDCQTPVLFCKMMAHHLLALDQHFLERTVNVILTRDPVDVLPSLQVQVPNPGLADTGYAEQVRLLQGFNELPVVDSRELLLHPESVMRQLCQQLGLDYEEGMLEWPAGPKGCDGVWAPHWYHNVHKSTRFQTYRPKTEPFPEHLKPLLEQCQPLYQTLFDAAIKGDARE
ncbi:MAG: hypothetical protein QNJ40_08755 [Xanthomonadales bacterium]|nr:hypothetical protein [Xanthomonadales bacterium]